MSSEVAAQEIRQISAEEVAQHNTPEDCWLVIHGKVYDVTAFAPEHPGGGELLTDHAGKSSQDVTDDFEDSEHSTAAKNKMKQFYIGDLAK